MKTILFLGFIIIASPGISLGTGLGRGKHSQNTSTLKKKIHRMLRGSYDTSKEVSLKSILYIGHKIMLPVVRKYLTDLPLDEDIKARVLANIKRKDFRRTLLPFLYQVKMLYFPREKYLTAKFEQEIKKHYDAESDVPGLEHELFRFQPPPPSQEKPPTSTEQRNQVICSIVNLYDAIYLQDPNYNLNQGSPPVTAQMIERIKKILTTHLRSWGKILSDSPDAADSVDSIVRDEHKMEVLTISLVDFLTEIIDRYYQMYHQKTSRSLALEQRFVEIFKEKNWKEILAFTQDFTQWIGHERKFAVHIIVDGLQGHLMEALSSKEPWKYPLLQQVAYEDKNYKLFRPRKATVEVVPIKGDVNNSFLHHLLQKRDRPSHYLPWFQKIYGQRQAMIVRNGVASTPTISTRNLAIALSGADVINSRGEGTGVPNFHYIDRKKEDKQGERGRYFFGNDIIYLPKIVASHGMKTPYERINKRGLFGINCNLNYDLGALVSIDYLIGLILGEKIRDIGSVLCLAELKKRSQVQDRIQRLTLSLQEELQKIEESNFPWVRYKFARSVLLSDMKKLAELFFKGLPDYLVYYNLWPDHFAHPYGPFSNAILSPTGELNRLDYWLGRLEGIYQRTDVYPRTVFAMVGDHGLSQAYYNVDPDSIFTQSPLGFRVFKLSSKEGEGTKMTHPLKPPSMRNYDMVVASTAGGSFVIDLFHRDRLRWKEQPTIDDLKSYQLLNGRTVDIINFTLTQLLDSLQYLVVRNKKCTPESTDISVMSANGKTTRIIRKGEKIYYDSPEDLLGVKTPSRYQRHSLKFHNIQHYRTLYLLCIQQAEINSPSTWCDESQWRELTSHTNYPDSVAQLSHLYDTDKAGTINLFPSQGVGFYTILPGRHAGEHFHEKDAFVGFWGGPIDHLSFALPPMTDPRLRTALLGQIPPTLFGHITGETPIKGEDGWDFAPINLKPKDLR